MALDLAPGDELTLFLSWKLTNAVPKNYSVFVHLVDQNEVIVAQRDMYPGQGSLPLSEMPVGYAWQDFYGLRLSTRLPTPDSARLREEGGEVRGERPGGENIMTAERIVTGLPQGIKSQSAWHGNRRGSPPGAGRRGIP